MDREEEPVVFELGVASNETSGAVGLIYDEQLSAIQMGLTDD